MADDIKDILSAAAGAPKSRTPSRVDLKRILEDTLNTLNYGPKPEKVEGYAEAPGVMSDEETAAKWTEALGHGRATTSPTQIGRNLVGEIGDLAANIGTAGASSARAVADTMDILDSAVADKDSIGGWNRARMESREKDRGKNLESLAAAAEGGGLLPLTFALPVAGKAAAMLRLPKAAEAIAKFASKPVVRKAAEIIPVAPTLPGMVDAVVETAKDPFGSFSRTPLMTSMLAGGASSALGKLGKALKGEYTPSEMNAARQMKSEEAPSYYVKRPESKPAAGERAADTFVKYEEKVEPEYGTVTKPSPTLPASEPAPSAVQNLLGKLSDKTKGPIAMDADTGAVSQKVNPVSRILGELLSAPTEAASVEGYLRKGAKGPLQKIVGGVGDLLTSAAAGPAGLARGVTNIVGAPALGAALNSSPWLERKLLPPQRVIANAAARAGISEGELAALKGEDTIPSIFQHQEGVKTPEAALKVLDEARSLSREGGVSVGAGEGVKVSDALSKDAAVSGPALDAIINSAKNKALQVAAPTASAPTASYLDVTVGSLVRGVVDANSGKPPARVRSLVAEAIRGIIDDTDAPKRVGESFKGQGALVHVYKKLSEASGRAAQADLLTSAIDAAVVFSDAAARRMQEGMTTAGQDVGRRLSGDRTVPPSPEMLNVAKRLQVENLNVSRPGESAAGLHRALRSAVEESTFQGMREINTRDMTGSVLDMVESKLAGKKVPENYAAFLEALGRKDSPLVNLLSGNEGLKGFRAAAQYVTKVLGNTVIRANMPTRYFNGIGNYSLAEWLAADTGIPSPIGHAVTWFADGRRFSNAAYNGKLNTVVGVDPTSGRTITLGQVIQDLGGDPVALAGLRSPRVGGAPTIPPTAVEMALSPIDAVRRNEAERAGRVREDMAGPVKAAQERAAAADYDPETGMTPKQARDAVMEATRNRNLKTAITNDIAFLERNRAELEEAQKRGGYSPAVFHVGVTPASLDQVIRQRRADLLEVESRGAILHDQLQKYKSEARLADRAKYKASADAELKAVTDALAMAEKAARRGGFKGFVSDVASGVKAFGDAYANTPDATYSHGYFSDMAHRIPAIKMLMAKGYGYGDALRIVKDRFLDYGKAGSMFKDLSALVFPFLGFSVAAFPKQLDYMTKHGLRAATWMQLGKSSSMAYAIANDMNDEEFNRTRVMTPAHVVGRNEDGVPMMLDLTRGGTKTWVSDVAADALRPGGSVLDAVQSRAGAPIVSLIVDWATGEDPVTHRKRVGAVERVGTPLVKYAVPPYVLGLTKLAGPREGGSRIVGKVGSQEKVPVSSDAGFALTGVRPRAFDLDTKLDYAARRKRSDGAGIYKEYMKRAAEAENSNNEAEAERLYELADELMEEYDFKAEEIESL